MIHYPPLEMPGARGQTAAMIIVGSDHWNEKPSLRFDLVCSLSDTAPPPPALAAADQIRVRLHLPDGSILQPMNNQPESAAGASMGGGTSWNRTYFFPWGPNALDEGLV